MGQNIQELRHNYKRCEHTRNENTSRKGIQEVFQAFHDRYQVMNPGSSENTKQDKYKTKNKQLIPQRQLDFQ